MYYKGRQMDRSWRETQMGLAISKTPTGPYVKHPANPVLDSGHEICVWPHGTGVGCLVCDIGPQGNRGRVVGGRNLGEHAGPGYVFAICDPELLQKLADTRSRARFFPAQFGVAVKVAAHLHDLRKQS